MYIELISIFSLYLQTCVFDNYPTLAAMDAELERGWICRIMVHGVSICQQGCPATRKEHAVERIQSQLREAPEGEYVTSLDLKIIGLEERLRQLKEQQAASRKRRREDEEEGGAAKKAKTE